MPEVRTISAWWLVSRRRDRVQGTLRVHRGSTKRATRAQMGRAERECAAPAPPGQPIPPPPLFALRHPLSAGGELGQDLEAGIAPARTGVLIEATPGASGGQIEVDMAFVRIVNSLSGLDSEPRIASPSGREPRLKLPCVDCAFRWGPPTNLLA